MARASVRTLIPLDRWAQLVGIHPIHFNQIQVNGLRACDEPIYQYPWQDAGRISREDIAIALDRAEQAVARELGYDIAPKWHTDDLAVIGEFSTSLRTKRGFIIGGGVEALSLVEADVAVQFDTRFTLPVGADVVTDSSSLDYKDKVTIEVTTSVTDPDEISIFYPASILEKLGVLGGDYAWEIRPITVSISDGVATITCSRHQLVIPELLEEWVPGQIDGLTDDNFIGLVDVYRHYNDLATQVEFRYRSCCCGFGTCGDPICTYSTQTGCLLPYNSRLGFVSVSPSTWNGNTHVYDIGEIQCERPEGALLYYRAGMSPIDRELELVVANLALSYLPQSICSCSGINARYDELTEDYVRSIDSKAYGLPPNPLGTSRAAFEAWQVVSSKALGRSGGHA